jgi:hypothetical protein
VGLGFVDVDGRCHRAALLSDLWTNLWTKSRLGERHTTGMVGVATRSSAVTD